MFSVQYCVISTFLLLSNCEKQVIDVTKSQVWGPGLKPADIVLPARYFFIHAIDNSGKKMSMTHKNYEVSIDGYSKDGKCRSNINYIDREDGSVIVRYTIVDWCEQMKIIVKHNSLHVAQSPYYIQKKVYSERCYCPQDLDLWLLSNGCSDFSKDSQISWDLHLFKRVNFSAIRENILKRYNAPESISLCHYVVKKQHIWRKCFGKYTGFKMFMDATLSSLARVVVLPEMEFYLNLGDWPLSRKGGQQRASGPYPIFSWCGSDDSYDITLPTYDITESTLENMGRVMLDMLSVQQTDIPWDNKEEKGFFRGRDSRRERLNLIELARKFPDMINASITNFFFFRNEEQKYGPRVPHISFMEFFRGFSCVDLLNAGMRNSGVFYLQIRGTTYWFLKVYCEQEISDGGWTVIQRRDDFGEPRENFNRDWSDYKNGFGEPSKEFWLGNENIYMLTNNEEYTLRVELEDFEGNKRYAQYSHFKIHSEADYYKLEIDGYEGNAGDSLNDPWYGSNNSPFSTYNKDNDRSSLNCASMLKGGWWWKSCGRGLNGLYLHDPQDLTARQGIVWFRWRGWDYTLKKATMMIRPRAPQPQSMMVTSV
ncbi:protein O-glucosyltransferase 2 isoform X5 [Drosophila guanche]|uniref:protein O-glucosyltransferase 2 isoform X5 n=1 Tax=Drosophila guanche TaxID=7266 RepID=UPI0014718C10|nr:protein O-glucosyltransferase 2 isoform X5 [Drosophila guanche]